MRDEHWLHSNYFQVDHNEQLPDEEDMRKRLSEYVVSISIPILQTLYTKNDNHWFELDDEFFTWMKRRINSSIAKNKNEKLNRNTWW